MHYHELEAPVRLAGWLGQPLDACCGGLGMVQRQQHAFAAALLAVAAVQAANSAAEQLAAAQACPGMTGYEGAAAAAGAQLSPPGMAPADTLTILAMGPERCSQLLQPLLTRLHAVW